MRSHAECGTCLSPSAFPVEFRKIEIKELPPTKFDTPRGAGAAAEEKGFVTLFNGKDLKGWKTHPRQREKWRVDEFCKIEIKELLSKK